MNTKDKKYASLEENEIFLGDFKFPLSIEDTLWFIKSNLSFNLRAENSINKKREMIFPTNGISGEYGPFALFADKRELQEQKITAEELRKKIFDQEYLNSADDILIHHKTFHK